MSESHYSEDSYYSEYSHYSESKDDKRQKYLYQINELYKINTTEFCALRKAMEKYEEQTGDRENEYSFYRAKWKEVFKYCDVLDIHKRDKRYVCSKERLDAIDFNIIHNYIYKLSRKEKEEVENQNMIYF